MNGLFFCTYLHAFDDCYHYDKDQRGIGRREALVIDLLSSCVSEEVREAFSYGIDTNSSTINQYFTGKRIPPDPIRQEKFLSSDSTKNIQEYFRDSFIKKIPEGLQDVVKVRIINLIKKDRTMPVEEKDKLLEEATTSSLDIFLADALVHAVIQPKPEDKWQFYFPNPPVNNLPNLKTSYFTGREAEIEEIKKRFDGATYCQSISGISGSGKTQLALEYAFWEFDGYDYIWWIDCESENTVLSSYAVIAEKLKLKMDMSNPVLAMREVQSWCQNNGFWLMIFDNVQYGKNSRSYDLKTFLPSNTKNGHILFTTLNDVPYRDEKMLHLGLFDEQTGEDFVCQRLELSESSANVRTLVNRLGGLPLGLEEACAFLRAIPTETIVGYIKKLDKYHIGFGDELFSNSTHEQTLLEVTQLTMQHIASKEAKVLLAANSFFKDQGVNLWMFQMAKTFYDKEQSYSELFQKLALDELEFDKAMMPLREFSLCRPLIDGTQEQADPHFLHMNQLYCHKLTQEIIREHFAKDNESVILGLELCYSAIRTCPAMTGDYYALVPDLLSFLENAESRFNSIDEPAALRKIASLFRYSSWALSDDDTRQKWLMNGYVAFSGKAFGFNSVEFAFACIEYFEHFAEVDFKNAFEKLNDACLILCDLSKQDCAFDHDIYEKRDGYPSIRLGSNGDNMLEGMSQLKLIADIMAGATIVAENGDIASAQKYCTKQHDWLMRQIAEFADDWNDQRGDEDDGTEDVDLIEMINQIEKPILSLLK